MFYAEPEINKCHVQINNSRHETRSAPEHWTPIVLVTSAQQLCKMRKKKRKRKTKNKKKGKKHI